MKKIKNISMYLAPLVYNAVHSFQPATTPFHSGVLLRQSRLRINSKPRFSRSQIFSEEAANRGRSDTAALGLAQEDPGHFRSASYVLVQAGLLGILSGWAVGIFKLSIDATSHFFYHQSFLGRSKIRFVTALIPAVGGLMVGLLSLMGQFPPGLRGQIEMVDESARKPQSAFVSGLREQFRSVRKSIASVVTLGTGCSLGPEGPSVEIGLSMSRLLMSIFPRSESSPSELVRQNRLLLACGAAAGVSAGFNAPITGVFFALEVMQGAFTSINKSTPDFDDKNHPCLTTTSASMSAVLVASVLSALVSRALVGEHLVLTLNEYSMKSPLMELPLYLLLGATSGCVALVFSKTAKWAQSLFLGQVGPKRLRKSVNRLPAYTKPMLGGLFCGLVGLAFPQVLFSGYGTVNGLLSNNALPTSLLLGLLALKTATTAVAAGSGLIGGTFAPSLFLGAMTGSAFHNVVSALFQQAPHGSITLAVPTLIMAEIPAYTMMGAASVLAAIFRAPLTACLLLFELTRDYSAMLPLMASCGVASVVGDILEYKEEERKKRDHDAVSWGDLSDEPEQSPPKFENIISKTNGENTAKGEE